MRSNILRANAIASVYFILLVSTTCWGISTRGEEKPRGTPMHKVQLTQKGYIQFLRWELPVPEISEFTFCLWMQSDDLTHSHSIFSYSKDESDRLVRSWISPSGKSIHLEIGGKRVFQLASNILENRWYHLCESWENYTGRYGLWVNGHLWIQGCSEETIGHTIPSGGDIVLGQEYTDFDKGLEDGIEGSVLGFNLLLSSAFDPSNRNYEASRASILPSASSYAAFFPPRFINYGTLVPISYEPRTRRYADNNLSYLPPQVTTIDSTLASFKLKKQPLGLRLVQLSYANCEIGRGSPFIAPSLMLISWTRTPVRIFGGAILKNVDNDCGNFQSLPEGIDELDGIQV